MILSREDTASIDKCQVAFFLCLLKIQSLDKEGFEIDTSLKENINGSEDINSLLQQVKMKINDEKFTGCFEPHCWLHCT